MSFKRTITLSFFLAFMTVFLSQGIISLTTSATPSLEYFTLRWNVFAESPIISRNNQAIAGLEKSPDSTLQKIAEHQKTTNLKVTDYIQIQTDLPVSQEDARVMAAELAVKLYELKRYNLRAFVVTKPVSNWQRVDYGTINTGRFDENFAVMITGLKESGLSTEDIGRWTVFPLANNQTSYTEQFIIDWQESSTRMTAILEKFFPGAATTIFIDSALLQTFDLQNLIYPHVNILGGSSLGIDFLESTSQFNNDDQASQHYIYQTQEKIDRLMSQARDIDEVWISFGIPASIDGKKVPTNNRQVLMKTYLDLAKHFKTQGFEVTLNFNTNRNSFDDSNTDWSFWLPGEVKKSHDWPLFAQFVAKARLSRINISLYDYL